MLKALDSVAAWRVDHGVQDWLEEGENKEQERLAAVKKIQPPSSEPVFFGFAGFPGFNLDQKYCPLSTTALKVTPQPLNVLIDYVF